MHRRIVRVVTKDDMIFYATFADGEVVKFDVTKIFGKYPTFKALQKDGLFENLEIDGLGYGISWSDEFDLSSDGIYEYGEHVEKVDPFINILVGEAINEARIKKGISQRELSKRSGVIQAEICKIEQGKGNPTLSTLQRLAKSLGTTVASFLI